MPTPDGVPVKMRSPRLQRHCFAYMFDLRLAVEQHLLRAGALPRFAIDETANAKCVRIDLVRRRDPWSEGRMGIERFAECPLTCALLPIAHADIIADAVSKHDFSRTGARHVAAAPADDHDKLGFVVELIRHGWKLNASNGPLAAVDIFAKNVGYGGRCAPVSSM